MTILYAPDNVEKTSPSLTASISESNPDLWEGFKRAFYIQGNEVLRAVEIVQQDGRTWFKASIENKT